MGTKWNKNIPRVSARSDAFVRVASAWVCRNDDAIGIVGTFSTSFVQPRDSTDEHVNRRRAIDENPAIDGRYFIRIIISRHVATRVGVHVAVDERCVGDADDEEGDAAEEPAATRCALFE